MLYSPQNKFLFIHIDKTAGSSIRDSLQHLAIKHNNYIQTRKRMRLLSRAARFKNLHRKLIFPQHATAWSLKQYFPRQEWEELFIFCFVRHPLDRITSRYEYLRKKNRINSSIGFKDYLDSLLSGRSAYRHQYEYITGPNQETIVNWWGKFETLSRDFDQLKTILKLDSIELPTSNISRPDRPNYLDYFTEDERRRAEEFTRRDLDLLGYS
jgi:hypothetical protein